MFAWTTTYEPKESHFCTFTQLQLCLPNIPVVYIEKVLELLQGNYCQAHENKTADNENKKGEILLRILKSLCTKTGKQNITSCQQNTFIFS